MERLRQLDQHYRRMMIRSDRHSTPFKRITRLYHVLVQKKSRTHVQINDTVVDANGTDKSQEGKNSTNKKTQSKPAKVKTNFYTVYIRLMELWVRGTRIYKYIR